LALFYYVVLQLFFPIIDWRMEKSWRFGGVHRKLLHNVWVMCILAVVAYLLFWSLILASGIIVGFMSHLIADSFTVRGVYWLYPIGRKSEKYHVKGSFSMTETKADKVEGYTQAIFFALAGFLFIIKYITLENVLSVEGIITIAIAFAVGFYLFQTFGKTIKRTIRRLGL
jgi:membrane-bound metal-dependent hydrolase YbcI (DUF457 family)